MQKKQSRLFDSIIMQFIFLFVALGTKVNFYKTGYMVHTMELCYLEQIST